jgi:hypothetical protein
MKEIGSCSNIRARQLFKFDEFKAFRNATETIHNFFIFMGMVTYVVLNCIRYLPVKITEKASICKLLSLQRRDIVTRFSSHGHKIAPSQVLSPIFANFDKFR